MKKVTLRDILNNLHTDFQNPTEKVTTLWATVRQAKENACDAKTKRYYQNILDEVECY